MSNQIHGSCALVQQERWSQYLSGLVENNRVWGLTSTVTFDKIYIVGAFVGLIRIPGTDQYPPVEVTSDTMSLFILLLNLDGSFSSFSLLGRYTSNTTIPPLVQIIVNSGTFDDIYLSINFQFEFVTRFNNWTIASNTNTNQNLIIAKIMQTDFLNASDGETIAVTLLWATTINVTNNAKRPVIALSNDELYFGGSFSGTVTIGTTQSSAIGIINGYYGRINPSNGSIIWMGLVQSSVLSTIFSLDTSNSQLVLSGNFDNNMSIGTKTLVQTAHIAQLWVAKLDNNGNVIWLVQPTISQEEGSSPADNRGFFPYDLSLNPNGLIYIAGGINANIQIGTEFTQARDNRNFILQMSGNGNFNWVRLISRFMPQETNEFTQVMVGSNDYVYITGHFVRQAEFLQFDPNTDNQEPVETLLGSGSLDMYIAKVSSTGQWDWIVSVPCVIDLNNLPGGLDIINNVYVTGTNPISNFNTQRSGVSEGNRGAFIISLNN